MSVESGLKATVFRSSLSSGDVRGLADQLVSHPFILIHVRDETDDDDELGALTADLDGNPHLVAFSSQTHATEFVRLRGDLFDHDEEVGGFLVEGNVLLDYLEDGYGLLINPDSDDQCRVPSGVVADILDELDLS